MFELHESRWSAQFRFKITVKESQYRQFQYHFDKSTNVGSRDRLQSIGGNSKNEIAGAAASNSSKDTREGKSIK